MHLRIKKSKLTKRWKHLFKRRVKISLLLIEQWKWNSERPSNYLTNIQSILDKLIIKFLKACRITMRLGFFLPRGAKKMGIELGRIKMKEMDKARNWKVALMEQWAMHINLKRSKSLFDKSIRSMISLI